MSWVIGSVTENKNRLAAHLPQVFYACTYQQTAYAHPLVFVTNGAIVIHTQRLKSDPGGNLLS